MMDISKVIGLEGGKDDTWFRVLAEEGRGETKYYPAIVDGEVKSWTDFPDFDDYMAAKVERVRSTIRLTVAGNAVVAEDAISRVLGAKALAGSPNTVDVYLDEPLVSPAADLGRKGGQSTSPAKQEAARENGKRGGRPKTAKE